MEPGKQSERNYLVLNMRKNLKSTIKDIYRSNLLFFEAFMLVKKVELFLKNGRFSDRTYLKRKFKNLQDYELDLDNPKTLNEKLQWLKIHDRKAFHPIHADKYLAREYIRENFGEQYLIPLEFHTTDYRELVPERLPEHPFVIKTNHGFGNSYIVRDKTMVDWKKLRMDYKRWLRTNYSMIEREWQYNEIEPRIIVEKLLLNKDGKVPNDYKLNFIEGKLEFIYVSVDREGANKRNIYDVNWNPLPFTWARKGKDLSDLRGEDIPAPSTLPKMIEFGTEIARLYKYARVDFYDVDGVLFFGEITQCHGGGFDRMLPKEFDLMFGNKMNLTNL